MYLLDTDTCIHVIKGRNSVMKRFREEGPQSVFLSAVSHHELLYGALHSGAVEKHLGLVRTFVAPITVLPFTEETAVLSSAIKQELASRGELIGPFDTLIAGQAQEHELTLVTGNVREFSRVSNLQIETW
jgi:tRNA(fMet)-specific endonuclease VapC